MTTLEMLGLDMAKAIEHSDFASSSSLRWWAEKFKREYEQRKDDVAQPLFEPIDFGYFSYRRWAR